MKCGLQIQPSRVSGSGVLALEAFTGSRFKDTELLWGSATVGLFQEVTSCSAVAY